MENKDETKDNILKGVNHKLKMRGIRIAVISIIICILIGAVAYLMLFVKQTPLGSEAFKDAKVEIKMETINQLNDEELPYNHLIFTMNDVYSLAHTDMHFYIENNGDNTSTLYFYFSQSYMQKIETQKRKEKIKALVIQNKGEYVDEPVGANILLSPAICKTDQEHINQIIKVYYLVYDYDNINQEKFDKVKSEAILLWEK